MTANANEDYKHADGLSKAALEDCLEGGFDRIEREKADAPTLKTPLADVVAAVDELDAVP